VREQNQEFLSNGADRQAQLLTAARALRTWIYDQKAAWPEPSEEVIDLEPPHFPVPPPPPSPPAAWTPDVTPIEIPPDPEPVAVETAAARRVDPQAESIVAEPLEEDESEPREWGPLLRQIGVIAAGVVVVAAIGAGGWKGWSYFANRPPAAPKVGTAVLESIPTGSELFIDGTLAGKTPVITKLPAGSHNLEFRLRNSSRKLTIDVPADGYVKEQLDWTAKRKGSLEVLSEPDGASVTVDGEPRGVTPLTIDDLPVGSHTVVLESDSGSIKRTVTIAADRVSQVTEAIYSGWVHVSTPIEVQISEGARAIRLDERNQVLLPPGPHTLLFQNGPLGYQERKTVEVKPGAIASISIDPPESSLTVTASLPGEVLVDGQRIGELPLADKPIPLGTRVVVVRSITGAERRFTVTATVKPVSLVVDFSRP
jgi:hypothetical protein